MKATILALALILTAGLTPAFAISLTTTDEVIRMHRAGVADDVIIAYVQGSRDTRPVTADDVAAMKSANVSQPVIDAVIEAARKARQAEASTAPEPKAASDTEAKPEQVARNSGDDDEATSDGGWCRTFNPPVVLIWPWDWYWDNYPAWAWDPWWYMPRLDAKSGATAVAGNAPPKAKPATAPPAAAAPQRGGRGRTAGFGDSVTGIAKEVLSGIAQAKGRSR